MSVQALCRQLGMRVPLVQAPIGSATCPELAAAVSNAGGLGTLAVSWRDHEEVRTVVRATLARTPHPFAVNVVLEWPQLDRTRVCLEEGVRIISTFWGDPRPYSALARSAGATMIHSVGSVQEAREAAESGVDIIVAQGVESGGHVRGTSRIDTLLPRVIKAVYPTPVLAAGGIATIDDVRRVMAAGASGVWVGTRFLCTPEAAVEEEYQNAILAAQEGDTLLTTLFNKGWEHAPHRVIKNSTVCRWLSAGEPKPGSRPGEKDTVARLPSGDGIERYSDVIPVLGSTGEIEALALYAGESSSRISEILPAAEVVRELTVSLTPHFG